MGRDEDGVAAGRSGYSAAAHQCCCAVATVPWALVGLLLLSGFRVNVDYFVPAAHSTSSNSSYASPARVHGQRSRAGARGHGHEGNHKHLRQSHVTQSWSELSGVRPMVYVHLHKAGGTLACAVFRRSALRTCSHPFGDIVARKTNLTWSSSHGAGTKDHCTNCNCANREFWSALHSGNGSRVARVMARFELNLCANEVMRFWPGPANNLAEHLRLGITLREPWSRHVSQFERDFQLGLLHKHMHSANCSIQMYSRHELGCDYRSRNTYGTRPPNFYVRALTGLVPPPHKHNESRAALSRQHLEAAKAVLRRFHSVLILEEPSIKTDLAAFMGTNDTVWPNGTARLSTIGKLSNNKWSAGKDRRNDLPPLVAAARSPEIAAFRELWYKENALDVELYLWARHQRKAEAK